MPIPNVAEEEIPINLAVERVLEYAKTRRRDLYQGAQDDFYRALNCDLGLCGRLDPGVPAEESEKRSREERAPWANRHQAMWKLQALISILEQLKLAGTL